MKRQKRLTRADKEKIGRLEISKMNFQRAALERKRAAQKLDAELAGSLEKYANGYVPLEKIREKIQGE